MSHRTLRLEYPAWIGANVFDQYTYMMGKPMHEAGSTITVTLTKGTAGWRMTAWAWAKH